MKYKLKLNQIREVLNMEVKLESAKLIDGTMVSYEKLEPGFPVFVVDAEGNETPAPAGEHMIEGGIEIEVDENGIIMEVSMEEEEAPVATEDVVEVSGSKKFEDVVEETKVDVAMEEALVEKVAEKIEEKMKMIFEAVEEVAKEVATIKEEMGSMKTKMEKFSKAPASNPIPKVSNVVDVPADSLDAKINFLKSITKK
jgi:hypothetical protein